MGKRYDASAFPPFAVTVDVVLLTVREGVLSVLLVERDTHPFRGRLALPGGFVAANEDLSAHPENVNQSPYGNGWLFKLKVKEKKELGELMASDEYAKAAGV